MHQSRARARTRACARGYGATAAAAAASAAAGFVRTPNKADPAAGEHGAHCESAASRRPRRMAWFWVPGSGLPAAESYCCAAQLLTRQYRAFPSCRSRCEAAARLGSSRPPRLIETPPRRRHAHRRLLGPQGEHLPLLPGAPLPRHSLLRQRVVPLTGSQAVEVSPPLGSSRRVCVLH